MQERKRINVRPRGWWGHDHHDLEYNLRSENRLEDEVDVRW